MSSMFYGCNKLISLPDISKWDTKNIINKNDIFKDCDKLSQSYIPQKFNK